MFQSLTLLPAGPAAIPKRCHHVTTGPTWLLSSMSLPRKSVGQQAWEEMSPLSHQGNAQQIMATRYHFTHSKPANISELGSARSRLRCGSRAALSSTGGREDHSRRLGGSQCKVRIAVDNALAVLFLEINPHGFYLSP